MDGTIVDTEPLWIAAQSAFLERRGLPPLTRAQEQRLVGASPAITAAVFAEQGASGDPRAIATEVTDQVVASLGTGVAARPGALALIREHRAAGVPLALVTNSGMELVDAVLTALGLATSFDTIVAAEDVTEGKPDPQGFLLAAERLGVEATECLVIEDSRNGLRGALAAGCTVLVVPHGIAIDPDPAFLRRDSLAGCSWDELRRQVHEFRGGS